MPILSGKSFVPERITVLDTAYQGACADLGVTGKTPHARAAVAKKILELADGHRRPEVIRAAVVASLKRPIYAPPSVQPHLRIAL